MKDKIQTFMYRQFEDETLFVRFTLDTHEGLYRMSEHVKSDAPHSVWQQRRVCKRSNLEECRDILRERVETYKRIGWKQTDLEDLNP